MLGQNYCECESIYKNKDFSGYCIEYLDLRWFPVTKTKAQFKRYTLYQKGRKSSEYPFEYLPKKDKILLNENVISSVDSVTLLNGLYKLRDKKGRIYEEVFYKNGFLTKHVVKEKSIWELKRKGKFVFEIAEYDYSTNPFRKHYIRYKTDGTIKYNYITNYDGYWYSDLADYLMSSNPLDFKGVKQTK